ncbi:hypothetical protein P3T37_001608 [Kitasatospora sp. MAA4]|uniref:hypothetical protein n=1 Tax=Kitasatospora sp. MAA4 TaxID=3035093 RepID=UPI002476CE7E|nr:hypothetical protein [Kitasatospora sp. MAA4]MDH6132223.1 hypothetical protein [Kitasatospora sp. MAA4]
MWVRGQRQPSEPFDVDDTFDYRPAVAGPGEFDTHPAQFALGLRLPGLRTMDVWADHARFGTGRTEIWDSISYAHCRWADPDGNHAVAQSGPRRLWDEVEAAFEWWVKNDRPGPERFGLTVTTDGTHRAWLDDPAESWVI